jgi:hypothetical protein
MSGVKAAVVSINSVETTSGANMTGAFCAKTGMETVNKNNKVKIAFIVFLLNL